MQGAAGRGVGGQIVGVAGGPPHEHPAAGGSNRRWAPRCWGRLGSFCTFPFLSRPFPSLGPSEDGRVAPAARRTGLLRSQGVVASDRSIAAGAAARRGRERKSLGRKRKRFSLGSEGEAGRHCVGKRRPGRLRVQVARLDHAEGTIAVGGGEVALRGLAEGFLCRRA
jgi:hypothetical protein